MFGQLSKLKLVSVWIVQDLHIQKPDSNFRLLKGLALMWLKLNGALQHGLHSILAAGRTQRNQRQVKELRMNQSLPKQPVYNGL